MYVIFQLKNFKKKTREINSTGVLVSLATFFVYQLNNFADLQQKNYYIISLKLVFKQGSLTNNLVKNTVST